MKMRKYIEYSAGNSPIVLSCAHGGYKKPSLLPNKLKGDKNPDKNTLLITKIIISQLKKKKIEPYYVISRIHRVIIDFNRPPLSPSSFNQNSIQAREIHAFYHKTLKKFTNECLQRYQKCVVIDIHGFTKPKKDYPDIIFGNIFGNSLQVRLDSSNLKNPDHSYWVFSEIIKQLSGEFILDDGLGLDVYNVAYSGGYIIHQFFQKNKINAFQLELSKEIRSDLNLLKKFISIFISAIINEMTDIEYQ
ncbi:MAG: N-formylglutamate amidohydrolase [Promethearchaeota archaeon]